MQTKKAERKQQPTRNQQRQERDLGLALAKAAQPPVVTIFKTSTGAVIRF